MNYQHLIQADIHPPTGNPSLKSYGENMTVFMGIFMLNRRLTDVKPMLNRSLLPKFPVRRLTTHVHINHDTRPLKTSLVTLPPLQTVPHRGPHRHLTSINCFRTMVWKWSVQPCPSLGSSNPRNG